MFLLIKILGYLISCTAQPQVVLSSSKDHLFVKKSAQFCGPVRLGTGWADRSSISCAINCIKKYSINCFSFMYNQDSHLCTPGGQLSPLQPAPVTTDGDLYVLKRDDAYENFRQMTYGDTLVYMAYYHTLLNYTQSLEACKCLDSTLYVAKTLDKFNLFASLVNTTGQDTWIGLDDIVNENQFIWVDDGQSFNWSYWSSYFQSDQPDNYKDEDCVEMHAWNQKLNDEQCSSTMYFMCEKINHLV